MTEDRPNILFINTDQQHHDTIAALGCPHARTPHLDRLVAEGTTFLRSYTADPVCCPARATWFTGRPPVESGVVFNRFELLEQLPDLGPWLGKAGYDPIYTGKWHVPGRDVASSFRYLPTGMGMGELSDSAVALSCRGALRNRRRERPFFLTAGLCQPHDICYWLWQHQREGDPSPDPAIAEQFPELPPNFDFDPREPEELLRMRRSAESKSAYTHTWSEQQWRYFLWAYHRHVEMADAEVGRILDALDEAGEADNTLVIFSVDHGECLGRHRLVTKSALYEEAVRVPLIVRWPGRVAAGVRDDEHLVSGMDFAPTVCDYAGVEPLPKSRGRSLRPVLEGRDVAWRDYIVASNRITGRMVRSRDHKYITYRDSPTEQLFDLRADPWETRNLAGRGDAEPLLEAHRTMLRDWESRLTPAPAPPTLNR